MRKTARSRRLVVSQFKNLDFIGALGLAVSSARERIMAKLAIVATI
jgi:hypothetical protein